MSSQLAVAYKDARGETYDRFRPQYPIHIVAKLFRQFGLREGDCVADIAAGTGFLSIPLMGTVDVHHIDMSKAMNDIARRKYAQFTHECYRDKLHISETSAKQTGLPDHGMDAIIIGNAAHWLMDQDYETIMQELHRILKPDGKIVIAYNIDSFEDTRTVDIFRKAEAVFPSSRIMNASTMGDLKQRARAFIAEKTPEEYVETYVWHMTREEFIGHISTLSFAIKDGIDEKRRIALEGIFDSYAVEDNGGKTLPVAFKVELYGGTLKSLAQARQDLARSVVLGK